MRVCSFELADMFPTWCLLRAQGRTFSVLHCGLPSFHLMVLQECRGMGWKWRLKGTLCCISCFMFSVKDGQTVKICSAAGQCCGKAEKQPCVPAGLVFVYLHHALQKHLSHRPGYVVLPNSRKSHLIDIVSFIFARNSGHISMSSGSVCVTAALHSGVCVFLRSLTYTEVSLLYKSDWNIAAQWLKFVHY